MHSITVTIIISAPKNPNNSSGVAVFLEKCHYFKSQKHMPPFSIQLLLVTLHSSTNLLTTHNTHLALLCLNNWGNYS